MVGRVEILYDDPDKAPESYSLAELVGQILEVNGLKTKKVDSTDIAQSSLSADDIHDNGSEVKIGSNIIMDQWTRDKNIFSYPGRPYFVSGEIAINAPQSSGSNSHWAKPKIKVIRNGIEIAIIDKLVMIQSGAYDGDATLNGSFTDATPGDNPSYKFEWFRKENRRAEKIPVPESSKITLKAVKKVEVLTK